VDVFLTTASRGAIDPMSDKMNLPEQELRACSPGLFDF
jgi:hypothetical protein